MRGSSRGDIDVALPRVQDLDRKMRRGAEAEQSHPLSGFDSGHAKTAEADDSGAQQRRGMQIVEGCGKTKNEIGAGERVFGVPAVQAVSGECRRIAEVLHVAPAVPASPVGAADPRDAYASSNRELSCGAFDDFSDDLVARNQLLAARSKFALDDMQIGAADTTGTHLQENMSRFRFRTWNVSNLKRMLLNWLRNCQNCSFHQNPRVVRAMILAASRRLLQTSAYSFAHLVRIPCADD